MNSKQRTIAQSISLTGKGLHTGVVTQVTIKAAPQNSGIKFVRTDLENSPEVPALAEYVVETSRSTVIGKGEVKISTIEHLLAAIWGSGIDNATIEINGSEVPILDGSAKLWVEAIEKVGTEEQDALCRYFEIPQKIEYKIEDRGVEIVAFPDDSLSMTVNVDFNSKVIGLQYATLNGRCEFNKEFSACRTFVFFHEIQPLIEADLIKGGDIDNAVIIIENELSATDIENITNLLGSDTQEILSTRYIAKGGLRFENEIARHKMLDLCGDLALVGCRLKGRIFATRPGQKFLVR